MRTFVVVVFVTVLVLAAWANDSSDAVASKASAEASVTHSPTTAAR